MMTGLVDIGCCLKYLKWHLVKRMIPQKFITNIQKEKNELLEQDTKELIQNSDIDNEYSVFKGKYSRQMYEVFINLNKKNPIDE